MLLHNQGKTQFDYFIYYGENVMNGKEKISVIIPCYNVQKYIMRCFDSIYSQTYSFENLEVILIDGLSTDNTLSIIL